MSGNISKSPEDRKLPIAPSREFILRLISAIFLASVALGLAWAGVWPFVLLIAVCTSILVWEWSGILGRRSHKPEMSAQMVLLIAASALTGADLPLAGLGVVVAGAVALGILSFRETNNSAGALPAVGVLYFGLPAIALVSLRSDPELGLWAIVFLFMVVWCEDTAAYVFGRLVKGPKLAPSISPGKTWSGAIAGIAFPVLMAYSIAGWVGQTSAVSLALVAAFLAFAAQIGDLAESATKRAFGIKDSSKLIPGHGGLLDRVDGLAFAAVAAGILALLRDRENPGLALLIW